VLLQIQPKINTHILGKFYAMIRAFAVVAVKGGRNFRPADVQFAAATQFRSSDKLGPLISGTQLS
jgi:hypothetical protein